MLMCTCNISTYRQYDPTRTTRLRNAFARSVRKRFNELGSIITRAIVTDDGFGEYQLPAPVQPTTMQMQSPGRRAFQFERSSQRTAAFMRWLKQQVDNGVLQVTNIDQVGEGVEQAWTNLYIRDSYMRGTRRARQELRKAGFDVPILSTEEFTGYMQQPFHVDRLGLLYTRTFRGLKGITDAMENQIAQVLTRAMGEGDNPIDIARKLNAVIKTGGGDLGITDTIGRYIPARRRAELLARTEIIRAHHHATIQEYRNWRVEGVYVQAEFRTAGDERVCDICNSMQGEVYTLDEAQNIIPVHPQCRCIMLPFRRGKDKPIN